MKVAILHLSDLHARGNHDLIPMAERIAKSITNLEYGISGILCIFTGDIANTGAQDEYEQAFMFIEELKAQVGGCMPSESPGEPVVVCLVCIPGNHDCDFSVQNSLRTMILESIGIDSSRLLHLDVVQKCIEPHSNFRDFQSQVETHKQADPPIPNSPILGVYEIPIGGKSVRILALNTAVLSRLSEEPSTLLYPEDLLDGIRTTSSITIAAMHHPFNWLHPSNAKGVQRALESLSDIILTGHEHDSVKRIQSISTGDVVTWSEGGALQDSEQPGRSEFNVLIVDTEQHKQKYARLSLLEGQYVLARGSSRFEGEAALHWEEFLLDRVRARNTFEFTEEALEQLSNPGAALTHRVRGLLSLQDVFVYPDLKELQIQREQGSDLLRGEHVLKRIQDGSRYLIVGEEQSGKTCLAKSLVMDLHRSGLVPLLIRGRQAGLWKTGDHLYEALDERVKEQYGRGAIEQWRVLERERRVVIVDDYDKLNIARGKRREFLSDLSKYAGRVVLVGSDIALAVDDAEHPTDRAEDGGRFEKLAILPFGHIRRNRLVEKWMQLTPMQAGQEAELLAQVDEMTRQLDALIGKNFVPAFPVYIMAVLQATEAKMPLDTNASNHAYFYDVMIQVALSKGRAGADYDIIRGFLSFMGYQMFLDKSRPLSPTREAQVARDYKENFAITRSIDNIISDMVSCGVLRRDDDGLQFKYRFMYYYFVASYLRDNIDQPHAVGHVEELCNSLFVEEYANILLFLSHLCKNEVIIENLMRAATSQFAGETEATFGTDVEFLKAVEGWGGAIEVDDRDPERARRDILEKMDNSDESGEGDDIGAPSESPEGSLLARLNAALKTLQILGQILKNYPGSLNARRKVEICEANYRLGLRALGAFLRLLSENQVALCADMSKYLKREDGRLSSAGAMLLANERIAGLAMLGSYGLIRRVSVSVGSKELIRTYVEVTSRIGTDAGSLILMSLKLDDTRTFPKEDILSENDRLRRNEFAGILLRHLVAQRIILYPPDFRKKHAVCDELGLRLKSVEADDVRKRIVGGDERK